jgi:hypothetical protein
MASNQREMEAQSRERPRFKWGGKRLRQGIRRVTRKSDFVHTKSILNAANNQAASWTIGSKPNANSHVGCARARRPARKPICDTCGSRTEDKK